MAKRHRRNHRSRRETPQPPSLAGAPLQPFFILKPETLLLMQFVGEATRFCLEKLVNCLAAKTLHPEAAEPVTTIIDEHQLGRSEVVREVATPKKN